MHSITVGSSSAVTLKTTSNWTKTLGTLGTALATLGVLHGYHALGAVPNVLVDAQQTVATALYNPSDVAVAPNGTVYVADTGNGRIMQAVTNLPGASTLTKVKATGYTFSAPQALAVDAAGDLFVSDLPVIGLGSRIVEIVASGGVLTATAKTIYTGLLNVPTSLAVYGNTLLVGDLLVAPGAVYSINLAGNMTPVKIGITGLPNSFVPSGLAVNSAGTLYMANSGSSGGVYAVAVTGGAAQPVVTTPFSASATAGVAVDGTGNLYLVQNTGTTAQVIEVPNPSTSVASTPFLIPTSNLSSSGGMAIDPSGNLDIAQTGPELGTVPVSGNGLVVQLNFANPVYLGSATVGQQGTATLFNFGFNVPATFAGLQAVTTGDPGRVSDVAEVSTGGTCTPGAAGNGSQTAPYVCYETFQAQPQYVGTRVSAIQVQGSGSTILSSTPVFELGSGPAQVSYPLDVTTTQLGLIQPQGVAISGFDQTVYVADQTGGKVYAINGLNVAVVSTGASSTTALAAPDAVAINGEGDLFIADFTKGQIVVVPTTTGIAPYVLNTGTLLQHPISLATDEFGDVFVGDAGAAGDSASNSAPGYVVEAPYKGSAFVLPISVKVIFPQALAFNNITGDLLIGDGGDISDFIGQVVRFTAGGVASVVSIKNPAVVVSPSGLVFDAAGNLYVLDGTLSTITVVSPAGTSANLGLANPSAVNYPSAMAASAGTQSFVVTNLGGGTSNSLLFLNGNSTTLAFGNQAVRTGSAVQAATVTNIGNQTLTLKTNFYTPRSTPGFALSSSETCAGGQALTAASPSCVLAFNFTPTAVGQVNQTITVSSNAYNNGVPAITLSGTGTAAAAIARFEVKRPEGTVAPHRPGRKSFAGARRYADR